jgi:hypothetical protein
MHPAMVCMSQARVLFQGCERACGVNTGVSRAGIRYLHEGCSGCVVDGPC